MQIKKAVCLLALVGFFVAPSKANALTTAGIISANGDMLSTPIEITEEIVETETEIAVVLEWDEMSVPTNNSFKSYMDAKYITDQTSYQYQFKSNYELSSSGIYTVDGRYCIAVGSYYTTTIGTRIDLVMDNGSVIPCILADCKADKDTDSSNRQNPNGSVVEFVVNTSYLSDSVKLHGDVSYADETLMGEIVAIRVYREN